MVDNENQWDEDIGYSQNSEQDYNDSYSEDNSEYTDQGYDDNYDNYEEEDFDVDDSKKDKKSNQLPLLIIALLLLGLAGFIFMSKMGGNKDTMTSSSSTKSQVEFEQDNGTDGLSTEDVGDMFFEQAGGNSSDMMSFDFNDNGSAQVADNSGNDDTVATVADANSSLDGNDLFSSSLDDLTSDPSKENNDIIISYDKVARENPFKPPVYEKIKEDDDKNNVVINNTQFEIIEPPTTSVPDENLTRLLNTQISGILYDDVSPSAIVNLNGVDSFVKVGDVISGYKIQSITRDKVQITYKNNSYVASVGELFIRGKLENTRAVANLEKKFAGRYKD